MMDRFREWFYEPPEWFLSLATVASALGMAAGIGLMLWGVLQGLR